jgi:PKD repeat protein
VAFNTPGTYDVQLVIANGCNTDTITRTICVVGPLIADFDIPLSSACAPVNITPDNNTDEPLCNIGELFDWEVTLVEPATCGSGPGVSPATSTLFEPQFNFTEPGVYQIELTASLNPLIPGTQCLPTTHVEFITIKDDPVVQLQNPPNICEGGSFVPVSTVDSCLSETPLTFLWDFNINNISPPSNAPAPETSTLLNPGAVTIPQPGTYDFSFTATNECGTASATENIVVFPLTDHPAYWHQHRYSGTCGLVRVHCRGQFQSFAYQSQCFVHTTGKLFGNGHFLTDLHRSAESLSNGGSDNHYYCQSKCYS